MLKNLLKQSQFYALANLVASLTSLISFPVLTKNLSVDAYGIVAVMTVSANMLASLFKFGMQHSVLRFFNEMPREKLVATVVAILLLYSLSMVALIAIVAAVFSLGDVHPLLGFPVLLLVLLSAFCGALQAILLNFLVAKQASTTVSLFNIAMRLTALSSVVCFILFVSQSWQSFVIATVISDTLGLLLMTYLCYRHGIFAQFQWAQFDRSLMRTLFVFGIPMFGYEMANMVHGFADRYVILYRLGDDALGIYSCIYNVGMVIGTVLVGGVVTAVVPIYLKTWKEQGQAATETLLSRTNDLFLLSAPAVIGGLYSVTKPMLLVLSTPDYAAFDYLLPIITVGIYLFATMPIYGAGLQLQKNSPLMFRYVAEGMLINIGLNLLAVDRFGILASAVITVISYAWVAVRLGVASQKIIRIQFNGLLFLRACLYAMLMVYTLSWINPPSILSQLLWRIIAGGLLYTVLVIACEQQWRTVVIALLRKKFRA